MTLSKWPDNHFVLESKISTHQLICFFTFLLKGICGWYFHWTTILSQAIKCYSYALLQHKWHSKCQTAWKSRAQLKWLNKSGRVNSFEIPNALKNLKGFLHYRNSLGLKDSSNGLDLIEFGWDLNLSWSTSFSELINAVHLILNQLQLSSFQMSHLTFHFI